ncbi:MAG: AIR synthase family protein [Clostridia bacterium]|nr:AIR synthase family protein [Clostridia bacterium]
MKLGKLDNDTLERLILDRFKKTRSESFGAPRIGMDCAMLDFGGDLIVCSCDPITSADAKHIGALSVHVNCNDAAAGGAEPVALLVTLLLPPSETEETVAMIANDLQDAAERAGVDIIGGHTEVTDAVTRVTTCATVLARTPRTKTLCGAKPGDAIVMTKWAGLEGTMLIASDKPELLKGLPAETVVRARALSKHLSVVPESRIAMKNGAHAMHDVTEGGVLGAVWELAAQTHCGVTVDRDAIPVSEETRAIADAVNVDPYRLMASGSLLIACENGEKMQKALSEAGIPAAVIGRITARDFRLTDGSLIDPPAADELYRLF